MWITMFTYLIIGVVILFLITWVLAIVKKERSILLSLLLTVFPYIMIGLVVLLIISLLIDGTLFKQINVLPYF